MCCGVVCVGVLVCAVGFVCCFVAGTSALLFLGVGHVEGVKTYITVGVSE